ncbi:MAG: hypothetical protein RMI91_10940 [Gemmatales bacterium]|nr:hypothetical protein [Gemmatales bacterium]MDW7995158.1 hypothetical protein [Gemmatales bacterium]
MSHTYTYSMRKFYRHLSLIAFSTLASIVVGQNLLPPKKLVPDQTTLAKIEQRLNHLEAKLGQLAGRLSKTEGFVNPLIQTVLADIAIYHKAARWIIRHQEWYRSEYPNWTLEIIERGIQRADQVLTTGHVSWLPEAGPVALGYRSSIDGSWQPYVVYLPADFAQKPDKKRRLDVILHGRQPTLTEVSFLYEHERATVDKSKDYIELHVYGRGNNGYRWAGETDVFEAILNWAQRFPEAFDPDRVVLRGFSMGGAGAWHLGLHYPHLWCSVSPGAGFTATRGYAKDLPDPLPPHQEACLRIYDAVDYAENAYHVAIVAYSGEFDPQIQAARNIEARLKPLGIPFTLIIGPKTDHRYHPESLKKILELQGEHAAKGRPKYPEQVRFVTYHPQYSRCHWVDVLPDQLYQRCSIEARWTGKRYELKTENTAELIIYLPEKPELRDKVPCVIDEQELDAPVDLVTDAGDWIPRLRRAICLKKVEQRWRAYFFAHVARESQRLPRKRVRLAGPIDDVFRESFVCIIGTGKPWQERIAKCSAASFDRFREEWSKYMRGDLPMVKDTEVTSDLLANMNLVLFGDPGSNRVLSTILDNLPVRWAKDHLEFGGQRYDANDHVPVFCYPSPFAPNRMLVVNSGHTFRREDYEGSNALLFPRLGDYAILRLKSEVDPLAVEVVRAGLFDSYWRLPKE